MEYKTILEQAQSEQVLQKSRFISFAIPIEQAQTARECLNDLRKLHPFATHICYAYVVEDGSKFSDDGEPQDTAGKPIFEVLRANDLHNVLIAVVRYFGGKKLGAGGLIRAYSSCASQVLAQANIVKMVSASRFELMLEYNQIGHFKRFCDSQPCMSMVSEAYENKITVIFDVVDTQVDRIFSHISQILLLNVMPHAVAKSQMVLPQD